MFAESTALQLIYTVTTCIWDSAMDQTRPKLGSGGVCAILWRDIHSRLG